MTARAFPLVLFLSASAIFCGTAQATSLTDVSVIRITSTDNTWLQVSEVVAIDSGGNDVALSSIAGVSTSSGGEGFGGLESLAINGIAPGFCDASCNPAGGDGIYHSSSSFGAFLEITLAAPTELFGLFIYGRTDNDWSFRDIYNVELFNAAGDSIFSFVGVDADNPDHRGDAFGTPIPIPAAAWLLMSGLAAFGALRRR